MKFSDLGIILESTDFQERSSLVTILSKDHGLVRAFVKYKGKPPLPQKGDTVNFHYYSRLPENLGNITMEIALPTSSLFIFDAPKIHALESALYLLSNTLREFDPCQNIFYASERLIKSLIEHDKPALYWKDYALFELELLNNLGFGLNLQECAVTGATDNICFISPKSGNAVTQAIGEPYQDKLFSIPIFWSSTEENHSLDQILKSLRITEHFLKQRVFYFLQKDLPHSRSKIMNHIMKSLS